MVLIKIISMICLILKLFYNYLFIFKQVQRQIRRMINYKGKSNPTCINHQLQLFYKTLNNINSLRRDTKTIMMRL